MSPKLIECSFIFANFSPFYWLFMRFIEFLNLDGFSKKLSICNANNRKVYIRTPAVLLLLYGTIIILLLFQRSSVTVLVMRSFFIVENNVFINRFIEFIFRLKFPPIQLFSFHRCKETFHHRIVVELFDYINICIIITNNQNLTSFSSFH